MWIQVLHCILQHISFEVFLLWNENYTTVNYVTWMMQGTYVGRQEMSAETSMFDKIGSLMILSYINVEYALTVGSV